MYLADLLQSNFSELYKKVPDYVLDIIDVTLQSEKNAHDVYKNIQHSKIKQNKITNSDFQAFCRLVKNAVIISEFDYDKELHIDIEKHFTNAYPLELLSFVIINLWLINDTHYNIVKLEQELYGNKRGL